ncbi:MAG: hypothetical protein ACYC3L_00875 [Gemmatimonadaceae bacterium]
MPPSDNGSFSETLSEAISAIIAEGYRDTTQIDLWLARLRRAAMRSLLSDTEIDEVARRSLGQIFHRLIVRGRITERVPGVTTYTLAMVKPALRAELDRRIMASADLIRLNRQAAIEKTLQRFSGWSTSIPDGGGVTEDTRREIKSDIGKSVAQAKYEARRVAIDQGHKLSANVADIVAEAAGAIAGIWHDRGEHDRNYDARKEHLARSGSVFLIRDSWAVKEGLVAKAGRPYTDEIEKPGQLVFCSCFYQYVTSLRALPDDMLTAKGRAELAAKAA